MDLIDRQVAIDYVDDVPYIKDHPNIGLLWKAWVERLPSAQPEIIRCKDCRWGRKACGNIECFVGINVSPWYCPNGERREE